MFDSKTKLFTGSFATVVIGIVIGVFLTASISMTPKAHAQTDISKYIPSGPSLAPIVEKTKPFVVAITSTKTIKFKQRTRRRTPFDDPFFYYFFGYDPYEDNYHEFEERGLGSGVIVRPDGYIITNAHLVEEADEVIVRFDNRKFDAQIIGTDTRSDIAILKIDAEDLPYAELGDSDKIRVGDWVLAIGNPFELDHTVTSGIISAKGRNNVGLADYEDFLQTDAAINPGNSGGALVDLEGRLIGINTAIATKSGGFQGVGFAIPINMAKVIMDQLILDGYVSRGWLGVVIQPVTPDLADAFNLPDSRGALISSTVRFGPADSAGIKPGDIVIAIDSMDVNDNEDFRNRIALTPPNTEVALKVYRNDEIETIDVVLGKMPDPYAAIRQIEETETYNPHFLGLDVQELPSSLTKNSRRKGVLITNIDHDSPLAESGVRSGDIILEINRKSIYSVNDFKSSIREAGKGTLVLLLLERDDNAIYVAVRM